MKTVAQQHFPLPATSAARWPEQPFPPLEHEARSILPTDAAAYYLNRRPQTLRSWASSERGPIRAIRINGRLAWSTAQIRALLNGGA